MTGKMASKQPQNMARTIAVEAAHRLQHTMDDSRLDPYSREILGKAWTYLKDRGFVQTEQECIDFCTPARSTWNNLVSKQSESDRYNS